MQKSKTFHLNVKYFNMETKTLCFSINFIGAVKRMPCENSAWQKFRVSKIPRDKNSAQRNSAWRNFPAAKIPVAKLSVAKTPAA